MAWVYILTVTGGIVEGDRLHTEIVARAGAQVHLTTPAATKIYRSPAAPSTHHLNIHAGAATYVEYLPEPIIPFRDARFLEEVMLTVHPTATLVYGSILSPGRAAMGESHVYDLYASHVMAAAGAGALEVLDVMHLTPATISPKRPGLLGKFALPGTLHLLTAAVPARALSASLHALVQDQGEILGGVSELPSGRGVSVRVLEPRAEPAAAALGKVVATARATLLEMCEGRAA